MTNFGTLAILALPKLPERQLRFLLALETVTRGKDGWRLAGVVLLAESSGLSPNTTVKARDELVASGVIEYRAGSGRGHRSAYRIKVPGIGDHHHSVEKVPKNAGYLSDAERYPNGARKGTQPGAVKVPKRNAVTSANATIALEPSALQPSALASGPSPWLGSAHPGGDVSDSSLEGRHGPSRPDEEPGRAVPAGADGQTQTRADGWQWLPPGWPVCAVPGCDRPARRSCRTCADHMTRELEFT